MKGEVIRQDIAKVWQFLQKSFGKQEKVAEVWIIEQCGYLVLPSQLHNWAIHTGTDTTDGRQNMIAGAKALWSAAIEVLPYDIVDGWVHETPLATLARLEMKQSCPWLVFGDDFST